MPTEILQQAAAHLAAKNFPEFFSCLEECKEAVPSPLVKEAVTIARTSNNHQALLQLVELPVEEHSQQDIFLNIIYALVDLSQAYAAIGLAIVHKLEYELCKKFIGASDFRSIERLYEKISAKHHLAEIIYLCCRHYSLIKDTKACFLWYKRSLQNSHPVHLASSHNYNPHRDFEDFCWKQEFSVALAYIKEIVAFEGKSIFFCKDFYLKLLQANRIADAKQFEALLLKNYNG